MKALKISGQLKKDLKRYKHRTSVLKNLEHVLGFLSRGEDIPVEYDPHMLKGIYKGHMECHVENDVLLIWFDKSKDVVVLVRFGSHSEVF